MTVEEAASELSKLNEQRKVLNFEPLDKLPESFGTIEQQSNQNNHQQQQQKVEDDYDETKTLAAFNKKFGTSFTTLEEFKPKPAALTTEQIAEQAEQRETAKIKWWLENGGSKKKYEGFIKDAGSPENLVYNEFAAEYKETNADATEEDIKDEFNDLKKKLGSATIKKMGEAILHQQYSELYQIDEKYNSFENQQKVIKEGAEKVNAQIPVYKKIWNDTFEKYNKEGLKFNFSPTGDNNMVELKIDVPKTVTDKIASIILQEEKVKNHIQSGYTPETIDALAKNILTTSDVTGFVKDIYTATVLQIEKGLRGIVPPRQSLVMTKTAEQLDPEVKKFAEERGIPIGAN